MLKKCIAEFLGTLFFLFVVLATGKVVPIGLALMVSIYLLNAYTSGMFNPAIAIMMTMAGKLPSEQLLPIIISEILGGLAALEIYRHI